MSTSARGQRSHHNDRIHVPNEQVFPDITDIMHTGIVCESEVGIVPGKIKLVASRDESDE